MDRLYKILIIDDDEYSADNLCLELKRYGQLVVEGIARNGSNGKKMIDKLRPDILFLDVEMPLVPVLAHMEMTGVCIDTDTLSTHSLAPLRARKSCL